MADRAPSNRSLGKVVRDVLTLNAHLYDDAQHIPHAKLTAQIVVGVAAISHAVGSSVILLIYRVSLPVLLIVFVVNALSIVAGYYFWGWTLWKGGQWLQHAVPSYKDVLVLIGLAHAPQIFNFFTVIPLLGRPIEIGLATWSLLAVIAAVNRGLQISMGRAIALCSIGWLAIEVAIGVIQVVVQSLLASPF